MALRFKLGAALDPALVERVERLFEGENLIETILHAHLLIERAITTLVATKLVRPSVLEEAQWSFNQKLSLYVGLYDPPDDRVTLLRAFNRLRNIIAHRIQDDAAAVAAILPWESEQSARPDALSHVRGAAIMLLFDLGAVSATWRSEFYGPFPAQWDPKLGIHVT